MEQVERKKRTTKKADAQEAKETKRPARVPYASNVSRLSLPSWVLEKYQRPVKCFRWVNDEEGEVQRRQDAWWDIVTDDRGEPVKRPVGPGKTVGSLEAYLMTCDEEVFNEDFKLQQEANMTFQNSLKRSKAEAGQIQSDNTYAPNLDDGGVGFSISQSETIK